MYCYGNKIYLLMSRPTWQFWLPISKMLLSYQNSKPFQEESAMGNLFKTDFPAESYSPLK